MDFSPLCVLFLALAHTGRESKKQPEQSCKASTASAKTGILIPAQKKYPQSIFAKNSPQKSLSLTLEWRYMHPFLYSFSSPAAPGADPGWCEAFCKNTISTHAHHSRTKQRRAIPPQRQY
jgi:hypothetical protein